MLENNEPNERPSLPQRVLRHGLTRFALGVALGAGAVHQTYQQTMHPIVRWESEEWARLDLVDHIDTFTVRRVEDDVLLSFESAGRQYNLSLKEGDVEVKLSLPWNILHVKVNDGGEIVAKTSNYLAQK